MFFNTAHKSTMKLRYCKTCLQPDTRPGIKFDENGICYACKFAEEAQHTDWKSREAELRNIAERAKEKSKITGIPYDCVIGVSGGKDSMFQAIYAKEKLGLHPLLVNCEPDDITEIGGKNIRNLSEHGFDMIKIVSNPIVARTLAKECFFRYGNMIKASEYALWASAFIIADRFKIPLIIQGENAAMTLGTVKNQEIGGDAYSVVQEDTIRGGNAKDLLFDGIALEELYLYQFPDIKEMKRKKIEAIFLQYYVKEWSQVGNADFAVARGLIGRCTEKLYDIGRYRRDTALDNDLQIANQMLKYYKFGFGFATDEACYDIREGRISRDDAIWLVKEYDGKCGEQYIDLACKYMSITKQEFWDTVDKFVNRDLFEKDRTGKWIPKFMIGRDYK